MARRLTCLILAAALASCLLAPSDESARVAFTLRTPIEVPPPEDGDVRDPSGQYIDLDRAGLYLRVVVTGPEMEERVGELVPVAGGTAAREFVLEMDVPAGDARSFSGVAYLRTVPAGQLNSEVGAALFSSDEPVVERLEEGALHELELVLVEHETGLVHGTISKALSGADRPDVTAVALVDAAAGIVLPPVMVHTDGDGPDRTYTYSMPGVPVGRTYQLRLVFLDGTLQDEAKTAFTLEAADATAQRDVVLE